MSRDDRSELGSLLSQLSLPLLEELHLCPEDEICLDPLKLPFRIVQYLPGRGHGSCCGDKCHFPSLEMVQFQEGIDRRREEGAPDRGDDDHQTILGKVDSRDLEPGHRMLQLVERLMHDPAPEANAKGVH